MDDIQRAIETLKNEKGRIVFGISNEVLMNEREMKFVEAIDIVISAMQELQQYWEIGTTGECAGYKIYTQNIDKLNCCNDCAHKRNCRIKPSYGKYCRINCYFWKQEKHSKNNSNLPLE